MEIIETFEIHMENIYHVESVAFGYEKEAKLVMDLLSDPTAQPIFSLLAFEEEKPLGHILFTRVELTGSERPVKCSILAPLAIIPEAQRTGVGGKLIEEGLERLRNSDVDLVFVLGHPEYYPRFGFKPAGVQGFEAPYPIPDIHADAWMVQALKPDIIGQVSGKVKCADMLDKPEHWRE